MVCRFTHWTSLRPWPSTTTLPKLPREVTRWKGWLNSWQPSAQPSANTHPSDTERKLAKLKSFFCYRYSLAIEGTTFELLFINIKLGLNAINSDHSDMVISYDVMKKNGTLNKLKFTFLFDYTFTLHCTYMDINAIKLQIRNGIK